MNAITLLKKDHQTVNKLFKEISSTTPRAKKKRKKLLEQVMQELKAHTQIEEQVFYPVLKKNPKTRNLVLEAWEEHNLVEKIMEDISTVDPADERWLAKFKVLQENVKHHVHEEENDLFIKAKRILSNEDLKLLGAQMGELKEKIIAGIEIENSDEQQTE